MGLISRSEKENSKDNAKDVSSDGKEKSDKIEIPIEEYKEIVEMAQVSEGNPCSVNPYNYYARKGPWEIFSF